MIKKIIQRIFHRHQWQVILEGTMTQNGIVNQAVVEKCRICKKLRGRQNTFRGIVKMNPTIAISQYLKDNPREIGLSFKTTI